MSNIGTAPSVRTRIATSPEAYLAVHAALDEPSTECLLDGRERSVRDTARSVCAQYVAPVAAELDQTKTFAHDSVQHLARAGLLGLLFPTELGGSGDSTVAYAAAMEEIAAACPATSLVFMTQTHAAYPIMLAGSTELARRYIPALLDGSAYGSLAITEADAGSDVSSLQTTARRTDDHYLLRGSKTFITTGDRADVLVCFATTDRTARRGGVTALVVDGAAAGLQRGRTLHKLGMHASTTAELFFEDVKVPIANRLGPEGAGWEVVMRSVIKSRISAAAQGVGIARGAYAHAIADLTDRYGPRLPAPVGAMLAQLRGRLLQARLLLFSTAREVDASPEPSTASISMLKQQCTDTGFAVAAELVRLLGWRGDLQTIGVERYLRDAKVTQIYDGTNEIQRMLVARDTAARMKDATR
ncbi:acyl-CoA dehydrogenase family protein [Mycolicibacterium sp. XJ1819]